MDAIDPHWTKDIDLFYLVAHRELVQLGHGVSNAGENSSSFNYPIYHEKKVNSAKAMFMKGIKMKVK